MKKLLAAVLLTFISVTGAYAEEKEKNNMGYNVTPGMVGIYGFSPDYSKSSFSDGGIGGGAFVYYNVINKIGGNFAIGLATDYSGINYSVSKSGYRYSAKMNYMPVALNFAYMTASDFLNVWAGLAFTYNIVTVDIKNGSLGETNYGKLDRQTKGAIGGDAFAGVEYIFTENKRFGAFFEFRYSIVDKVSVKNHVTPSGEELKDTLNFNKFRYTLGVTFHF